ncbi:MAG: hypothetical protein HC846_03965 [Blastocatellia bacterium]|nr:hypothetical protein [Blastocatellia bacterium]
MTEKNQKMPFGQIICMALCVSLYLALSKSLGFGGGALFQGIACALAALLGAGIYYLFTLGKA